MVPGIRLNKFAHLPLRVFAFTLVRVHLNSGLVITGSNECIDLQSELLPGVKSFILQFKQFCWNLLRNTSEGSLKRVLGTHAGGGNLPQPGSSILPQHMTGNFVTHHRSRVAADYRRGVSVGGRRQLGLFAHEGFRLPERVPATGTSLSGFLLGN
jgi:hypothetical protein